MIEKLLYFAPQDDITALELAIIYVTLLPAQLIRSI